MTTDEGISALWQLKEEFREARQNLYGENLTAEWAAQDFKPEHNKTDHIFREGGLSLPLPSSEPVLGSVWLRQYGLGMCQVPNLPDKQYMKQYMFSAEYIPAANEFRRLAKSGGGIIEGMLPLEMMLRPFACGGNRRAGLGEWWLTWLFRNFAADTVAKDYSDGGLEYTTSLKMDVFKASMLACDMAIEILSQEHIDVAGSNRPTSGPPGLISKGQGDMAEPSPSRPPEKIEQAALALAEILADCPGGVMDRRLLVERLRKRGHVLMDVEQAIKSHEVANRIEIRREQAAPEQLNADGTRTPFGRPIEFVNVYAMPALWEWRNEQRRTGTPDPVASVEVAAAAKTAAVEAFDTPAGEPKPRKMTSENAESYAKRLADRDSLFVSGTAEQWAKRIAQMANDETGVLWSCAPGTASDSKFWDDEMERQGRGRKGRGVKSVSFTDKVAKTVGKSGDVLEELASNEEQRAIDVVMKSAMRDEHKAATIKKVKDGEMTPAQASELVRTTTSGRKPKSVTAPIRE